MKLESHVNATYQFLKDFNREFIKFWKFFLLRDEVAVKVFKKSA